MILLMYALITIKPIIEFYGIIFGWILALFQMIITIIGFVFLFISIWGNSSSVIFSFDYTILL